MKSGVRLVDASASELYRELARRLHTTGILYRREGVRPQDLDDVKSELRCWNMRTQQWKDVP